MNRHERRKQRAKARKANGRISGVVVLDIRGTISPPEIFKAISEDPHLPLTIPVVLSDERTPNRIFVVGGVIDMPRWFGDTSLPEMITNEFLQALPADRIAEIEEMHASVASQHEEASRLWGGIHVRVGAMEPGEHEFAEELSDAAMYQLARMVADEVASCPDTAQPSA